MRVGLVVVAAAAPAAAAATSSITCAAPAAAGGPVVAPFLLAVVAELLELEAVLSVVGVHVVVDAERTIVALGGVLPTLMLLLGLGREYRARLAVGVFAFALGRRGFGLHVRVVVGE